MLLLDGLLLSNSIILDSMFHPHLDFGSWEVERRKKQRVQMRSKQTPANIYLRLEIYT
jgi:hypothetical protein